MDSHNITYFHHDDFQEAIRVTNQGQTIDLFEKDSFGNTKAFLRGVFQDESSGKIPLVGMRAIVRGVPIVDNNDLNVLKKLLLKYIENVKTKVVLSQFRNTYDLSFARPLFQEIGFTYYDHLNYLFDLSLGIDRLWQNTNKIVKKNVTRAYKKGVSVEITNSINDLMEAYDIVSTIYYKLKLPLVKKEFIKKLLDLAKVDKGLKVFVAKHENQIIGTRMVLLYKGYIYDYYAGSKEEYYNKYPNDLLPWEVIKWGSENKMRIFDFGGAGHPNKEYGVREYKKKFGGELVNYGRFEIIHKPFLYKISKAGFKIMQKFR